MIVKKLKTQEIADYEMFLEKHCLATITQSTKWAEFQQQLPSRGKVWRLGVYEDRNTGEKKSPGISKESEKLVATCLVVKHLLPKGLCWLYSQGGPVGDYKEANLEWLSLLKKEIKKIAKKEGAIFWRISPLIEKSAGLDRSGAGDSSSNKIKKIKGFRKAHAHYQPESTLKIDLTKPEDEILKEMKQKGRYNIKVAKKHNVVVKFSDGSGGDIEKFYKILEVTTDRDGFSPHDFEFYMKMLQTLTPTRNVELVIAEAEGETLAGAIITYYGDTATYYYGASSNKFRNYMAPYLVQWEAIKNAKNRGYKFYDFLGIAPEGSKDHPWQNVTEFKLKFGGERIDYLPEREAVFRPFLFWVMKLVKKLRFW